MAITSQLGGQTLFEPGSYSETKVALVGSRSFVPRGRVAIFGEADGGEPGASGGFERFTAADLAALVSTYRSGRLVEAARQLVNPSNDNRIVNGASEVLVFKTNASTQAVKLLATSWGQLKSRGYGVAENLISFEAVKSDASLGQRASSTPFDSTTVLTAAQTFLVRESGAPVNTFTMPAAVTTRATLQTALNAGGNWSGGVPANTTFTVGGASDAAATLTISIKDLATDHTLGYARVLELIDGAGTLLADMNISTSGLLENTTEPALQVLVARASDNIAEDSDDVAGDVGGVVYLELGYQGTTGTVTLNGSTLVTAVTGGTGVALSLAFSTFKTLNDLAEYINSQTGYTASVPAGVNGAQSPAVLDRVTTKGICSTFAGLKPGQLKADAFAFADYLDRFSSLVVAVRDSFLGLPDEVSPKTFLSGAVRGASLNSDFTAALTALEAEECDLVVPLLSQDASDDLVEDPASTDASSTYTAESILTAVKNHCKKMGSVKNRKERQCYEGFRGTFEACQTFAKSLGSELASLLIQDVLVVRQDGSLGYEQPFISACLAAGMQAGGEVGQPTTKKYVAANGIRHVKKQGVKPSTLEEFKPLSKNDQAIAAGIMPLASPADGGIQIVVQNSTYSKDGSFVFNRPSVLDSAFFVAKNLRKQLDNTFIGTKNKGLVTKETIRVFVTGILADFLKLDIIVGDDSNEGLGYKGLTIGISGSEVTIDVTITPVQGIDFILNRITLDTIRVAA